jgi:cysteine-rich repeat protein
MKTEECDDGNDVSGDGCSASCQIEPIFDCVGGSASKPDTCSCQRVRRDWKSLSAADKQLYYDAINDLKKSGTYDKFVHIHALSANEGFAHGTGGFLPWHRWYLFQFEEALRNQNRAKYGCLALPYWDWGEEADLCAAKGGCSTLHEMSEIIKDFGGLGNAAKTSLTALDYNMFPPGSLTGSETAPTFGSSAQGDVGCLTTGPFANWIVSDHPNHEGKRCLSRSTSFSSSGTEGFTSATTLLVTILQNPGYGTDSGFRARVEGLPHANPHNLLGGHIRTFSSPSDPLFFSHHTYVDKLWSIWQDCHDYDKVDKADLTSVQYDGVNDTPDVRAQAEASRNYDHIDAPMPFFSQKSGGAPATCDYAGALVDGYSCLDCVKYYDDWCTGSPSGSGQWDSTCAAQCSSKCADYCGGSAELGSAKDLFSDWDRQNKTAAEITPRNMHNIRDPDWLGYSYEPDEYDRRILQGALSNSCSLGHSFWHLEGHSDDRRKRHLEAIRSNRRLDSVEDEYLESILNYVKTTVESEVANSIYLDGGSKELSALEVVMARQCQMLYKKDGVSVGGDLDVNADNEDRPGDVPAFWRRWNMAKDFQAGATLGACKKYL